MTRDKVKDDSDFLHRTRIIHFTQVKMEDFHKLFNKLNRYVRTLNLDSSSTTQMAKIMVQYGRPSRSSWTESVRSSFGRTVMGSAIWENPIETWLGENSKLGMSLCSSWKRIILICSRGWHKNWLDRNKTLIRCGTYSTKKSIWENYHLSWIMYTWAALNDNVKWAKILWTITEPCSNREFSAGWVEKLPFPQNLRISSWSYDVAGHAKKCVDR